VNEDAVRALVRELIARHMSGAVTAGGPAPVHEGGSSRQLPLILHPSHARYAVASGEEADGPCFIEPAVRCNHCGYCQSHGH
jgi:hypothetical protein